jgi:hypothetical protein
VPTEPLSTLLSQVLVAHTIELDNEFEQRLLRSGERARIVSVVMWSNFLRFVGEGITVGELTAAAGGLANARVLSNVGGMERWGYVSVAPDGEPPTEKRDGRGSSRGLRKDWVIRPTAAGRVAREAWPELLTEIEARWRERFGAHVVDVLLESSRALLEPVDHALPDYVPVIASTDGFVAGYAPQPRSGVPLPARLVPLLAQVLLAYTLEFERESDLALPLVANVVRVAGTDGILIRDVPAAAGISKEATSVALTALTRSGHVTVDGSTAATKSLRLTARGEEARDRAPAIHAEIETGWAERSGADSLPRLRPALETVLEDPKLADGLRPHADGWRAAKPYLAHTEALLRHPREALPHYPMVLHRGGWPDGS